MAKKEQFSSSSSFNSGETRVGQYQGKDVIVSRNVYLDRYGNPVHRARILNKDGTTSKEVRGNGPLKLLLDSLISRYGNKK